MFVNGLDRVNIAFVAPDDSQYGKFMLAYCKVGKLQVYSYHKKHGFDTASEAVAWYLNCYPSGNLLDQASFLSIQNQLLALQLPNPQANAFDPLHMTAKPRPAAAKRDKTGKLMSDFE